MFAHYDKYMNKYKVFIYCGVAVFFLSMLSMVPSCTTDNIESIPEIISFVVPDENSFNPDGEILKVMTLNLGHGKGRGITQEFVSNKKTRKNLDKVAEILVRERPHVVAFQEADIKSRRSGNFNHIHYIAEQAAFRQTVQGEHLKGFGFHHGTALISMLEISNPLSVVFDHELLSSDKGFTVCTVEFGKSRTKIDVVSVHLDLVRNSTRQRQVRKMVKFLSKRGNPLVVMGDFNCQLQDSKEVLDILNNGLSLSAYELYSNELQTFPLLNRRIDWILISSELEFYSYTVCNDRVSDHLAVIAELMIVRKYE